MKSGVYPKTIQERLGHASAAFTLQVYGHLAAGAQAEAANAFAELTSGDMWPKCDQKANMLYWQGYTERELTVHRSELVERHPLGKAWEGSKQKTLINRWINKAKEKDPDLDVWHVLNRRKRRPGIYTNWEPKGKLILSHFMDHLTRTKYFGPGDTLILLGD